MTETNPPADTRAADLLVADARRAVHESLTFLAAPEADRVRALIADLETAVEGRTAIRFTAATTPAFAPTHPLRDRLDTAIDGVFDRWKTGLGDQTPQDAVRDAVLAVLPAPTDRAALPVRPQTLAAIARHLEARAVTILRPDSETYAEYHAVAAELRRLADAASGPGRAAGETRSYAERVNAPLSESTITALNQRLRAGDTPVHTVRRRADGETQQDETQAADRVVAHVLAAGTALHCLRCAPTAVLDAEVRELTRQRDRYRKAWRAACTRARRSRESTS